MSILLMIADALEDMMVYLGTVFVCIVFSKELT